jgi:hypothetical protein
VHIRKIEVKLGTMTEEKGRRDTQDTVKHEMLKLQLLIFTRSSYYAISANFIKCECIGMIVTYSSYDSNGRVSMQFDIRCPYNK